MRFDNLEEFLKYYYENGVNIAAVEFTFDEIDDEAPAVTADVIAEPVDDEPVDDEQGKLVESFNLQLASGTINVKLDDNGYMLVDDYSMTPNSCGTGHIVIEGRKLHLNMCETDGKTKVYLTSVNGPAEAIPVRRKS